MKAEIITLLVCAAAFGGYAKFLHGIHTHGIEPLIRHHMKKSGCDRVQAKQAVRWTQAVAWLVLLASGVVGVAVLASLAKQMGY